MLFIRARGGSFDGGREAFRVDGDISRVMFPSFPMARIALSLAIISHAEGGAPFSFAIVICSSVGNVDPPIRLSLGFGSILSLVSYTPAATSAAWALTPIVVRLRIVDFVVTCVDKSKL